MLSSVKTILSSMMISLAALLFCASRGRAEQPPWRPFSDDSPWNTPIPEKPAVDPDSETIIGNIQNPYGDVGLWIGTPEWSVPVYYVDSDRIPWVQVTTPDDRPTGTGFGLEQQSRTAFVPIPDHAIPATGGDHHLAIVDIAKGIEWGMWYAVHLPDGWSTALGATADLKGTGVRTPADQANPWPLAHGPRASGFPLMAGMIRVDEMKAGEIRHALAFAYMGCLAAGYVSPASTGQADLGEERGMVRKPGTGLPMGGRIQLDPTLDVDNMPWARSTKIIAKALQVYGAYCGDYGGACPSLCPESSPAQIAEWSRPFAGEPLLDRDDLHRTFTLDFAKKHFRVLEIGPLHGL